ncbi:MAG: hypothetical protein CMP07_08205 [Xanthomonadales bacterium]|nr:hypothetical protein [Xanthomonadales bacterium]
MRPTTIALLVLLASTLARADGSIEINQACVPAGCFAGDSPGFPVEIVEPGSYRLSSNLQVPTGLDGIVGSATGISLDLAGFEVSGPVSCTADIDAITDLLIDVVCTGSPGTATGIADVTTIENGTVRGFRDGIRIGGDSVALVRNVHVRENSGDGIDANHRTMRIVDSTVSTNGNNGVTGTGDTARLLITGSIARENGDIGIYMANGVLRDSLIILNGTEGGVRANVFPDGPGSLIADTQFVRNQVAIVARPETAIRDSLFIENGDDIVNGATSISGNLCDGVSC